MRRNIQRWQRNIGGNIGGRGASPNSSIPSTFLPVRNSYQIQLGIHPNLLRSARNVWGRVKYSPPATLVGLISDLCRNTSPTPIPPTNLHSYHCHYQPATCAIYCSTTRAPPCSTHIPCLRPIISCMYQFLRSWVLVTTRTCEDLSQHPSAPFGVRVFSLYVHSTTICFPS